MITEKPILRVRLVRAGVLYCALTALVLFIASYVQANLLFWIFSLMAGGLFVSLLMPLIMIHKLSVQRRAPSQGIAGEMLTLQYDLTNQLSWLPAFGVLIHENWGEHYTGWQQLGPVAETPARLNGCPHGWAVHVGPGLCVTAKAPCWPLRRGMLGMEQIIVLTSFPFGIFEWRLEFMAPGEILIYPQMYRINRRIIATLKDQDMHGHRQVNRSGGYEEFYGLREYHESDSIKLIHWRRSAHSDHLVSKEMTTPAPPKVMVLLDLSKHPGKSSSEMVHSQLVEQAISLAASIVSEAHHFGYRVGLAVLGSPCSQFAIENSMAHRLEMLEALARLDVANQLTDPTAHPEEPSIIVCVGDSRESGATFGSSAVVLSAKQFEQYIMGAGHASTPIVAAVRRPVQ